MIIDAHAHITRAEDAAKIIRSAARSGIERIMVSSLGTTGYIAYPTPQEFVPANSSVIEAIEAFPNNILGLCYVNPQFPKESLEELDRCIGDGPMVGIKLWVAAKASDVSVEPIARKAIELDVPILQHAWNKATGNLKDESDTHDIVILARKFPELRIQMAHLHGAGFKGIADIAPIANICVDTCGGDPEAGIVEYAVREIGVERILFGTDAPGRGFAVQLGKIAGANISEQEKEMILWKNAERIYKI